METGFELFAFSVAAISRLTGAFRVESGRLLNSLLFIGSSLLLFRFSRTRYGPSVGMVALAAYALGFPLSLYIERSFVNEASLILITFVALRSAQCYLADHRGGHLAVLVVSTTLIGLIKLPWLIVWAPLFGLLLERDGARALRRWEPYALAAVNLVGAWFWYSHARELGLATGLSFGMTDKLFDAQLVGSLMFPFRIAERLTKDILGPVGILAVCVGLVVAWRCRGWCEVLGMCGFGAYLVIVAKGNDVHDYYQLPIVPVAAVLVGLGVVSAIQWLGARKYVVTDDGRLCAYAVVIGVMLFSTWL